MYAIIATGGKQYKVSEGDVIRVEKLDAEVGSTVTFDNVSLPPFWNNKKVDKTTTAPVITQNNVLVFSLIYTPPIVLIKKWIIS